MGSQLKAICTCGIESEILIGGRKFNFRRVQYFPCQCKNCKDIVQVNLKSRKLKCPNCNKVVLPYNDPTLVGVEGKEIIARSFDDLLTNGTYECPKCENHNLRFVEGHILWD
jgi:predicted RNA-binding Zn-ribbon protein involved in translation (DUF1610 family)